MVIVMIAPWKERSGPPALQLLHVRKALSVWRNERSDPTCSLVQPSIGRSPMSLNSWLVSLRLLRVSLSLWTVTALLPFLCSLFPSVYIFNCDLHICRLPTMTSSYDVQLVPNSVVGVPADHTHLGHAIANG